MKHLTRAMVVAVAASTLVHYIETKVVDVELASMTDRP